MPATIETDESALLRAIIADPADDTVRIIYADWLDEHKQPERAEFIRVQIAIHDMDENGEGVIDPHEGHTCFEDPCPVCPVVDKYNGLNQRVKDLLDQNWARWSPRISNDSVMCANTLGDMRRHNSWVLFHRGFVSHICLSWKDWLTHWQAIREATPLEEATLSEWPYWGMTRHGSDREYATFQVKIGEGGWIRESIFFKDFAGMETSREAVSRALSKHWPGITFTLPPPAN